MSSFPFVLAQNGSADANSGPTDVIESLRHFLVDQGAQFGLNLILALAIFIIGRWVSKILVQVAGRLMQKSEVDRTLRGFLCNLTFALLMTVTVIAALSQLGVDTTSLAAIAAAAGLAVGLALQNSLGNFASGVMLLLFRPFKVGDFVSAGGSSGVVEEIQIFNTVMRTGDNVQIIIPNGSITAATISNFSAKDTRRIDLVVSCGYEDDLRAVKAYLQELVATDDRILKDPEPVVAVNELGDNSVNFVVRPWVKSADYWPTRWALTEKIKLDFDLKGFNIPYPAQDIHLHQAS